MDYGLDLQFRTASLWITNGFGNTYDIHNPLILIIYFRYTLSGQKYLYTAKYPCTDCAIYRLKNQLGTKMGIEICRDQKFIVLALTLVKFFDF